MNQDIINLTKKSIENCEANRETLKVKINRLEKETREAERELFRVNNVKQSLESALERLEEADEKEKRGIKEEEEEGEEDPAKEEMEFIEKQDLPNLLEDSQKLRESPGTGEIMEEAKPGEELTGEERTKKSLADADQLIEREKKREEQRKKGWKLCSKCNSNRISPGNKKGICTPCQQERKTSRPYRRK